MEIGAVDERLTNNWPVSIPAEVLRQVLADHDCSASECAVCGYRPTRRQPVCRSSELAKAVLWGRKPKWAGEVPAPRTEADCEQMDLFASSEGCA